MLGGLQDILLGRDDLVEAFVNEFRREVERLHKTRGSRQRVLQKDLNRVNGAISRCLAFITGGDGDPGLVRDELNRLQARKSGLEQELKADIRSATVEPHPNTGELYRRKVGGLQKLLNDETARPEAMEVIRSLIDRIEVHAGNARGKPEVILVGALASILTFAWTEQQEPQTQTAASRARDGGRVLVVAGVGFEPTTFRL